MSVPLPAYIDWEVARLVNERIVTQHELLTQWSLEDVWDHHVILDTQAIAHAKANDKR